MRMQRAVAIWASSPHRQTSWDSWAASPLSNSWAASPCPTRAVGCHPTQDIAPIWPARQHCLGNAAARTVSTTSPQVADAVPTADFLLQLAAPVWGHERRLHRVLLRKKGPEVAGTSALPEQQRGQDSEHHESPSGGRRTTGTILLPTEDSSWGNEWRPYAATFQLKK